jgi:YggT family protein
MFIIGNLVYAIAFLINTALTIYMYIIVARAVISWVNPDPYNAIVRFLYSATEPLLSRIRRLLPATGGLDLSPIIVILLILFLQKFLVSSLFDLVARIKYGFGG